MLPLGKSSWCTCKNCKKDLVLKNLPASYSITYKQLRKKARTPWWAWLGLGFLVFMAILGAIFMTADKKRNARMLESLQKGDVIGVELTDEKYVLYRVADIRADSVFYRVSKRTENEIYLLDDLKEKSDEEYKTEMQVILKSKLVEMNNEGTLKDISRKVIK